MLLAYVAAVGLKDTSQYKQTTFLLRKISSGTPRTFIEFGCRDGTAHSNTKMLEQMGWEGICIEPVETIRGRLHPYQGAVCPPSDEGTHVNIMLASAPGLHGIAPDLSGFRARPAGIKRVECFNLNTLRENHDLGRVGYVTVDTEGTEAQLLRSYNFEDWAHFLQVECNNAPACSIIKRILRRNFELIHTIQFHNGHGGCDLLFRNLHLE